MLLEGAGWGYLKVPAPNRQLQLVAQIADGEALPIWVDISAEGDGFEEFAHFLRGKEGLAGSSSADVGLAFRFALGGKQVGEADVFEGVVHGVVAVVAYEGAAAALGGVVILGGVEAVVDKEQGAAREALGEGADKGFLAQVQFAGVAVNGGQQLLGGE